MGLGLMVLLALAMNSRAIAQPASPYVSTRWTTEDGLPVNSVNDMVQTPDGYLWLATYDGLVRFDGQAFTVYRTATHDGLPGNRITNLFVFSETLWLYTESGSLVRAQDGRFQEVGTDVLGAVRTLHPAPDGTLWVGTTNGLFQIDDGRIERAHARVINEEVHSVLSAVGGSLWVGTRHDGVYQRTPQGVWHHQTIDADSSQNAAYRFYENDDGSVWIAGHVSILRSPDGTVETIAPFRSTQSVHVRDRYGLLPPHGRGPLLALSNGVYRPHDGRWERIDALGLPERNRSFYRLSLSAERFFNTGRAVYRKEAQSYRRIFRLADPDGNEKAVIERVIQGRQGNIWIGTRTQGLIRLQQSPLAVVGIPEGLASNNVYPIEQRDDGSIWAGTLGGGVSRIQGKSVTTYLQKERNHAPPFNNTPMTQVWSLHEGRSGFWIGGTWVCRFARGRCTDETPPTPGITRFRAIYEDRQGHLWVGSENGLYRRASASDPESEWTTFLPETSGLPHPFVRVIREAPNGSLWFGTNGGGIAHYANGAFVAWTEADGLPSNLVREIYRDSTGVLWIGTEDNGLARIVLPPHDATRTVSVRDAFDRAEITHIGVDDGLFDDVIHRIIEVDGRLWMSTNRGLFWVRKEELHAFARGERDRVYPVSYTARSGMRSREANGGVQPAGLRADDGRLWFPTQNGAVVVDPQAVQARNRRPPPVTIEHVTVDGQRLHPDTVDALSLDPGPEEVAIRYTALEFTDPNNVQFRYRLAGIQSSWSKAGARRMAFFVGLPPGTYTFEVQARHLSGPWTASAATLSFTVAPHVYETTWFYILCALVLGGGVYGAFLTRTRLLRRRAEKLDRVVNERTQQLRDEQRALRKSETRFRAVFEGAAAAIAVLDADRRVRRINPTLQELFQLDAPTARTMRFEDLLEPTVSFDDDAPAFHDVLTGHRDTYTAGFRFRRADGTVLWGQTSVSRLPACEDQDARLLVFVLDITQRKQLEERIRQSERMETVGRLAGGMAHEFNNILHTAQSYLEMGGNDRLDRSTLHTFMERSSNNLDRAAALIDELLAFTKQNVENAEEPIDVAKIARDAVGVTKASFAGTVMHVSGDESVSVPGDPDNIHQVVVNLVKNAAQAVEGSEGPSRIDVRVSTLEVKPPRAAVHVDLAEGPHVALSVSDTGPGMDKETRKSVFDPFFSTKTLGKGTGLGLASVYGIVKAHGGETVINSEVGLGTTVTVYLPAYGVEGSSTAPLPDPSLNEAPRILFVAADMNRYDVAHAHLCTLGCTVQTCRDASTARDLLASPSHGFDLVVTGFALPERNGLTLTRSLRDDGHTLPVIVTSVYRAHLTEASVREAGGTAVLHQPVGQAGWANILRTALLNASPSPSPS